MRDRLMKLKLWQIFLILMVVRIPYLIAYYPGLMIWDTGSSIAQFYGFKTHVVSISTNPDAILSNHHMILLTFLMGGAVKLGELLGSQNFGFFLYTLAQVALTNFIVAYGLWSFREKCARGIWLTALVVYALLPVFSIWQLTVSKDAIFSAFALLLVLLLYRLVESEGQALRGKKYTAALLATNLMVILTKPQGVYISLITFGVLAVVFRKQWKKVLLLGVLPGVLYLTIFTGMILPALNVAGSGKQEMWGFAFQQTARYVCYHGEEVTQQEQEAINAVLPYDQLTELYTPTSQDPVKFAYKQQATKQDLSRYLCVWAKMFFKHPETYICATFNNVKYLFVPNLEQPYSYFPVTLESSEILNEHDVFELRNVKIQPFYSVISAANEKLATTPVIMLIYQACFYVWLTVAGCVLLLIKRNYRALLCLIPLILSVLILVIAPVVEIRYVLLPVYCASILVIMALERKEKRNGRNCGTDPMLQ